MRKFKAFFLIGFSFLTLIFITACNQVEDGLEDEKHTVIFITNSDSIINTITGNKDELIQKPGDPVKPNYTFDNWYFDIGLSKVVTWPLELKEDYILYAKWLEIKVDIKYELSFETNEGSLIASINEKADALISKPLDPTKDKHIFEGWYLDAELTKAISWPLKLDKDYKVYAKWSAVKYELIFESNEGTVVANIKENFNSDVSKPLDPTKNNHIFEGWYLDTELTKPVEWPLKLDKDYKVYAKWVAVQYELIFEANEGTSIEAIKEIFDSMISEPKAPNKDKHIFEGWYFDVELTKPIQWPLKLDKDYKVYAKWIPVTYEISFESNEGSVVTSIIEIIDSMIHKPVDPTLEGYLFDGWYFDDELTKPVEWPLTIDKDYKLFAKWSLKVEFSRYDTDDINIIKSYYDGYKIYYLSNHGKIYLESELFNPKTQRVEKFLNEFPIKDYGLSSSQKIIDFIAYDPVILIKLESGRWYGLDQWGDFLGIEDEIISIDELLELEQEEYISEINILDRLFYCFTNLNRVFVAGSYNKFSEEPIYYEEVVEITDEFDLDEDEYFIMSDQLLKNIYQPEPVILTNKRKFILSIIAKVAFDSSIDVDSSNLFIDLDSLIEKAYHHVNFYVSNDYAEVIIHYADNSFTSMRVYYDRKDVYEDEYELDKDEEITIFGYYTITNKNKVLFTNGFEHFEIEDQIKETMYYYTNKTSMYPNLMFKTINDKYYKLVNWENGNKFEEVTKIIEGYIYQNGYFIKDGVAYYLSDKNILEPNSTLGLSKFTDEIKIGTVIDIPELQGFDYEVLEWYGLPNDNIALEDIYLYPQFKYYEYKELSIVIYLDEYYSIYTRFKIAKNEVYDIKNILAMIKETNQSGINEILDFNYVDIDNLYINGNLVDNITFNDHSQLLIELKLKDETALIFLNYYDEYQELNEKIFYGTIGEILDIDDLKSLFDFEVEGIYRTIKFIEPFEGELIENNTVYVNLLYPTKHIKIILPFENEVIDIYYKGYIDYEYIYYKLNVFNNYFVEDFYLDKEFTKKVYNLSDLEVVYVKYISYRFIKIEYEYQNKMESKNIIFTELHDIYNLIEQSVYLDSLHEIDSIYYDKYKQNEFIKGDEFDQNSNYLFITIKYIDYREIKLHIVGETTYSMDVKLFDSNTSLHYILSAQNIYINDTYMVYKDADMTQMLGVIDELKGNDLIDNDIYLDLGINSLIIARNEESDIHFTVLNEKNRIYSQIEAVLRNYFDLDNYAFSNELNQEVNFAYDFKSYEEINIIEKQPGYYKVSIIYNKEIIDVDWLKKDTYYYENINNIYKFINYYMSINSIYYDEISYYLDSKYENKWSNELYDDMIIYVETLFVEKIDLKLHLLDKVITMKNVNIDEIYSSIDEELSYFLYINNLIYHTYEIYLDKDYEIYFIGELGSENELYIDIINQVYININIHYEDIVFKVYDILVGTSKGDLYDEILYQISLRNLNYDDIGLYLDSSFTNKVNEVTESLSDIYIKFNI